MSASSWGTKGDNTLPLDLGVVSTEKGPEAVQVVELTDEQEWLDKHYDEALQNLQVNHPITKQVKKINHQSSKDFFQGCIKIYIYIHPHRAAHLAQSKTTITVGSGHVWS